jgi:glycosyltransferase involved in cell wall biosynthesis
MTSAHMADDLRIFGRECRSLARAGYAVAVVGPFDRDCVLDGIRILAVRRARSRRERMTRVVLDVCRRARREDADLYHFHDPELMPVGWLLKTEGRKVIYDVHENLPMDILRSKPFVPPWLRRGLSGAALLAEWTSGQLLDGIVTVTDGFARRFPSEKTAVVQNFAAPDEVPVPDGRPHAGRDPIVVFTGGLHRTRCAVEMVDAIGLVQDRAAARLVVCGHHEEGAEALAAARPGWKHTTLTGQVRRAEVMALLGRARVALCMNAPRADYTDISTHKLYEYMLAGLPIVASDIPSWRRVLEATRCGLVVDSEQPARIADAIVTLMQDPQRAEELGRNGRAAALTRYGWAGEAEKLVRLYQRVLGKQDG